jgi:pimeloyl-ACP methyl ester carboxylesterase
MAGKTRPRTKLRSIVRVCVWSLVVLVVAVVVANNTVAKLPSMPPADGKYISLRGKEIHYVEQPGQGVPVVMIHGLPGTYKDFDPVIPDLKGKHVIAVDRPGFGWSKGGWLPYQDQIDVVHELLAQLKLAPAVLVGHSFGGTLALGVARRYPEDIAKLVLLAPGAGGIRSATMNKFNARYVQFSQLPIVQPGLNVTVNNVIKRIAATSGAGHAFAPEKVDPTFEQRLLSVSMTPGNLAAFASDELEFDDTSRWVDDNVPQIRVPSVIIGAKDDQFVGMDHIRRLADTLPGAQMVTVDGSHMIPYTHPDVIAEQVKGASR